MGEHASKERQTDVDHAHVHVKKGKQPMPSQPSAEQVDKLTVAPSGVVIGDQCVFGDNLVGSTSFCNIPITSSHAVDEADVRMTYGGPREMQIVSMPTKLRPDVEGPTGQTPLRLAFQPTTEGSFRGALTIDIALRDGTQQTHHVIVAGRAHAEGTPDWDERDRSTIAAQVASDEQNQTSKRRQVGERAVTAMEKDTTLHPALMTGQADIYGQYQKQLGAKLVRMYQGRQGGIDQARHRAEGYKRKPHHHKMSVFAEVAIELASVGVGAVLGAQGKALVEIVGAKLTGEAFSALIEEGVKAGASVIRSRPAENLEGIPQDEVHEFFGLQDQQLYDAEFAAQSALLTLHAIMFPVLTRSPERAIQAIKTMIAAIESCWTDVRNVQSSESSRQWIRYVAHASMGDNRGENSLVNMDQANKTETADRARPFDGLVDLFFSASLSHPQTPVKLESARMTGVKAESLVFFANKPFLEQGLPIRALGKAQSDALLNLVVLRDERGGVAYTDTVGEYGEKTRFFERKGGGDADLGARQVLNELASEPLGNRLKVE